MLKSFKTFSKCSPSYMGWDPPPEYNYNFQKDEFPFCRVCNLILIRIYKIHEDIQSLEKQIQQFVLSATANILTSECKVLVSGTKEVDQRFSKLSIKEIARPGGGDAVRLDEWEIGFYYRETVSKRFSARVQLTSEDAKQLENYKRAAKSTTESLGDLDQDQDDDTHGDCIPSREGSDSEAENDPRDVPKANKNRIGTTRNSTSARNSSDQELSGHSDGLIPSPQSSVYPGNDPADVQQTKENNNRNQTVQISTSAPDCSEGERSGDSDKDGEEGKGIPGGRKLSVRNRIKELSTNEFVLDDKMTFVFLNPCWKCSACNETTLERNIIVRHITSTLCSGLVSPKSVKELQYRGFKYDKLDDGRFECRRCPFGAPSKSSLERHIVGSHWNATKKNTTKLNLVKKLIKSASINQPCPNLFLVNDKHEFRLKGSKFACGVCSFCTRTKSAIIRHVFQKHENLGTSRGIVGMKIQRLGPNKYKLGDFPFQAFSNEYKCLTCGHACSSLVHMKQHIRYEHVKDMSKNVCDICGYSTFYNRMFKDHVSYHKDDRPFLCPTCGKSFKVLTNLLNHEAKVHPKSPVVVVKSHLCEICGKKFKNKSILTLHTKTHENVACEICGKTYNLLYLAKHLDSHNAEKRYECKQCGSKFQQFQGLYTHRKSCSGEKPYSCDICGMKFTQSFSVTRHKSVVHNPEKKTRTCVVNGPRKQRRGQSLLTVKESSSGGRDKGVVE